jgi:hypothetical protein
VLRAEAAKAQTDKSHATPFARAAAFAVSKGYVFTADEAKERAEAVAKAAGKELTDDKLDGVAGGGDPVRWDPTNPYDWGHTR